MQIVAIDTTKTSATQIAFKTIPSLTNEVFEIFKIKLIEEKRKNYEFDGESLIVNFSESDKDLVLALNHILCEAEIDLDRSKFSESDLKRRDYLDGLSEKFNLPLE